MSVITAVTAQNTFGVARIHYVPLEIIRDQIDCVVEDIYPSTIKIGMLGTTEICELVTERISRISIINPQLNVIFDPVMVAKGGARLLECRSLEAVKKLCSVVTLITPNVEEAQTLLDITISTVEDMRTACEELIKFGSKAVLLKGGHLETFDVVTDVLYCPPNFYEFSVPRINTQNTHGTGCTLSAAIASYLALGNDLPKSVQLAKDYITGAILHAPTLGHGHGPLNHTWKFSK
eukprot:TRINITY_DN4414_c0_g1_i9.p1 TRINITY_DN4414_c0_g1~~TRINITY_DN4414_c0_g1_i9.p1  ORF type:complete len:235 (+),score=28.76 TRINITY_DN4414_c0_g1_i9:208-912(+)